MIDPEIEMTQEEAKNIALQIENEIKGSDKSLTLQELAKRLKKPEVKVEICADRLLEAGRIQYKPISGTGLFGFTHKPLL